jgi:predicted alpha-1,2-mannosidase
MSGTGCASYGDVPILPTTGPLSARPAATTERFSHSTERAAPGRYRVVLGRPGITTELSVTTRTGLARLTFPRRRAGDVLFKVSSSASGTFASNVAVVGRDEVVGAVHSGQFCGTGTDYTLHFVARFDRSFASAGTWAAGRPPSDAKARCGGGHTCGAYVTFDTEHNRTVEMKVGISFVSAADAARNLAVENRGWSLAQVEHQATQRWNTVLDRIRIGGGTRSQRHIFYTALYHSMLHPNVVSDVNGRYMGEDHQVHRVRNGAQYANFSEWDIYRSEIELIALLEPRTASQMVQSLLADAAQDGWLPKWAIVGGDASQMNGDSADPIIAGAYAFGARRFDTGAALAAMVKGATRSETPSHGLEIERQYLDQYLTQHYVDATALDLDSIDYSIGASVTLEYAVDDFAIAQLAQARGERSLYRTMMSRAQNWTYEFNPATGSVQARTTDGSFPPGPPFNPALFEDGGETGFEEGNASQYTWSVPQDLAGLAQMMGGDSKAVAQLDTFFTKLNAARFAPYDWAGNEPDLGVPWEYDAFRAPWRAQDTVRRILLTEYHDAPVDEPGNDDLGAMSSWYVWGAMGLYPLAPGTADLALASPLFPTVAISLPGGRHLVLHAPGASARRRYVQHLTLTGTRTSVPRTSCSGAVTLARRSSGDTWNRPWLPVSVLRSGGTLTFRLERYPDHQWGTAANAAFPSWGTGSFLAVGYTVPSGGIGVRVGRPTAVTIGARVVMPTAAVVWHASTMGPVALSRAQGTLPASTTATSDDSDQSDSGCTAPVTVTRPLTVTASAPGHGTVTVTMRTSSGRTLPPVVLDVTATS